MRKKTFFKCLKNQSGAMFGMDARIALLISSVLAAAGGVTLMSKLERNRIEAAELGLHVIKNAIETHYTSKGITALAESIEDLYDTGFLVEPTLLNDPWQNGWKYKTLSREISIADFDVIEHLVTVHSAGKDGVNDTQKPTSAAEWATWAPQNDDIGTKYSTIEIEKSRINEYKGRAKMVIDKLEAYASGRYLEAQNLCDGEKSEEWCLNLPEEGDRYSGFNFYPKSNSDNSGAVYFDQITAGGSSEIYVSGDIYSMESLMEKLSLPKAFAKDPWERILIYDSNYIQERPNANKPPFTASIAYE